MPLLKVDSSLRQNPLTSDPSDCTIESNELLEGRYELKSILIPVTYWNVNSSNNKVYFTDTGGAQVASLTSGYYTSFEQLVNELVTQMNAVGAGTVTASINSLNNYLTVNNSVNFSFTFGTNTTSSASKLLGFTGNSASATTSQLAQRIMNLKFTTAFNFHISDATSGVKTLTGQQFTFSIPALTTTPGFCYYAPIQENPISFILKPTKQLSVKITDDDGRVLNNMKSEWTLFLQHRGC